MLERIRSLETDVIGTFDHVHILMMLKKYMYGELEIIIYNKMNQWAVPQCKHVGQI